MHTRYKVLVLYIRRDAYEIYSKNKTILIERQPIVELSTSVPVQIIREPGTEHLTFERIIVNGVQQISNTKLR